VVPDRVAGYEILTQLGGGGMGLVFEARDPTLKRVVALKILRPGASEDVAARFLVEAEAIARLVHPNIIPIHDHARPGEVPFYTMPRAAGSLASRMAEFQADPRAAVALMEKVARAVQHAHDHHVLHRDLKPGNILIDAAGEPLVADFGLAKLLDAETDMTQTGALLGTPSYMAPEQASGRLDRLGSWTDVWALGVILYELATGQRPFTGRTRQEVTPQILDSEPPRPRSLKPNVVDRRLESVILACLRKEPGRRYPSAGALADDLGRWLHGGPVLGVPESVTKRARRYLRRRTRAEIVLAGVVAAAMVFAVMLWTGVVQFSTGRAVIEDDEMVRQAAAIQAELDQGRSALLTLPDGSPRWHRWAVGNGALHREANPDDGFTVNTGGGAAWLQLAPNLTTRAYRVRAEIRQNGDAGFVGLYVGASSHPVADAPVKWASLLWFAERGPLRPTTGRGGAYWQIIFTDGGSFAPGKRQGMLGQKDFPMGPDEKPVFHAVEFRVDAESQSAYWGEERIDKRARADLIQDSELAKRHRKGWEAARPQFTPDGGLGIIVYQDSATVRNVVIDPIHP
jgi:hypothetical protein